jgi:predicted PurR-regulated permease PerM
MALAVVVILLAAVAALVWAITAMVEELPNYNQQFIDLYNNGIEFIRRFNEDFKPDDALRSAINAVSPTSIASVAGTVLSSATSIGGIILVILATLIFLAMDAPTLSNRMRSAGHAFPKMGDAMESFIGGVRKYWVVTTVFGLIIAFFDGLVLVILDVPLAWIWALLSFLTNYIPNIGFVIGLAPPALLALIAHDWQTMLIVIVAYSLLNFIIQTIIQPKFTGETVGVSPTISFIALLLWTYVLGGIGALIALPMTLLVKALLIDIDPNAKWLDALITSEPAAPPTKKTKIRVA